MDTLFDTDEPKGKKLPNPKTAKPPAWVVSELTQKWKCSLREVRSWHAAKAFAILYRYRDGAAKKENAALVRRQQLSAALVIASASEDFTTAELLDLLYESLTNLDAPHVAEVARVVASLLKPPG